MADEVALLTNFETECVLNPIVITLLEHYEMDRGRFSGSTCEI